MTQGCSLELFYVAKFCLAKLYSYELIIIDHICLFLKAYQVNVVGITTEGNITVSSNNVTILPNDIRLDGAVVTDGSCKNGGIFVCIGLTQICRTIIYKQMKDNIKNGIS